MERIEVSHANVVEHAFVFRLDNFLYVGCQRLLEQVVVVDAQMAVFIDGDEEHCDVVNGITLVFLYVCRVGFLTVEHATAGEGLVEGDATVLIFHVSQLGDVHALGAALRIAHVKEEASLRNLLVIEQLAGCQKAVKTVASVGVATQIGYFVVDGRTVTDVVAHHDDVVGLQGICQYAAGYVKLTL